MPPWNSMNPQQQQQWLQLLMSRGPAGMQFGGTPPNPYGAGQPLPPGPGGLQTAPGFNPLANQAQNQMNPAMLQYILGMQGQQPGMQQPTLAQLLQMHGMA